MGRRAAGQQGAEQYWEADRLERSAFLRARSGMLFGLLSWLLVAGLFLAYYGSTAHDDADPLRPGDPTGPVLWAVVLGWALVTLAVLGSAAFARRFRRFAREVRQWAAAETAADPAAARPSRLETRLLSRSTRGSTGPGDGFIWGGILMPPFGAVVAPLALIVLVISVQDAAAGTASPSATEKVELGAALLASLLVSAVLVQVLVGLSLAGSPLRAWRSSAR